MARPIRVEFAGAVYHVTARGNERRAIFRDDQDRRRFLQTVGEMVEEFGVRVLAYCLMPNHYHLVVSTPLGNLSQALGWLQVTYTVRFNRRHRRSGHLFQGRFKAQLVEADEYARWLVEYVHLNPVRTRQRVGPIPVEQAAELARYEWSSHRDYAGLRKKPAGWLCLDWLRYWDENVADAQREYRRAMGRWFSEAVPSPWTELRSGLVLGGEALLGKAHELIGKKKGQDEARWTVVEQASAMRDRVRESVKDESDEIKIWARIHLGRERRVVVAREFGYRDGSGVTHLLKKLEQNVASNPREQQKLTHLKQVISSFKS
ncbi:MAG TPA: transposase [Verrucomicrobiae bacterium]|nr:transposase [Verrucomicrobiae bacterium]